MRYQRHLFILRWHYCEICSVILVLDSAHDRRDNWLVRFQQLIRPQRDSLVGSYWFLFYFYWCKSNYLYLNGIPFEKVLIQPLHFAKFLKKPIFVLRGHLQSRNLETTHLGHSYESFFFLLCCIPYFTKCCGNVRNSKSFLSMLCWRWTFCIIVSHQWLLCKCYSTGGFLFKVFFAESICIPWCFNRFRALIFLPRHVFENFQSSWYCR